MPEMEQELFEFDGLKFSVEDVKAMTEQEITSLYQSITASPENGPALNLVSSILVDRGIF